MNAVVDSGDLLGLLALLWVIYLFTFEACNRAIAEAVSRLRLALSTPKGALNLQALTSHQAMGARELIAMLAVQPVGVRRNMIGKFEKQYQILERWKVSVTVNLFLLTAHGLWRALTDWHQWWERAFVLHIGLSLAGAAAFYLEASRRCHGLEFLDFKQANQGEGTT